MGNISALAGNYSRFDLSLVRGEGSLLFDDAGKEYIDFLGGISVCALGHCPKNVAEKLKEQIDTLWHVSNLYRIPQQEKLAEELVSKCFADQVFFCNSGTEAVEACIKLARVASLKMHGKARPVIAAMDNSFHGRTMGSLSVTGTEAYRKPFEPLVNEVRFLKFGDTTDLERALDDSVGALILEPMQAEGGLNLPPDGYLKAARDICTQKGIPLIFDEVQVGMGRLSKLFAHQLFGVEPDIMALAKGLGGGLAIGAMLAKEEFSRYLVPGTHASTFGGNYIACTGALEVLKTISEHDFMKNIENTSQHFAHGLDKIVDKNKNVSERRGIGMLQGLRLNYPAKDCIEECMKNGLLIGSAGSSGELLRFAPALNIPISLLDEALKILSDSIKA